MRTARFSVLASLSLLIAGAMAISAFSADLTELPLRLVCSTRLFRNVTPAEVVASGNFWMEKIGVRWGLKVTPQITLTDSVADMQKRTDNFGLDILISSALEYEAIGRSVLEPVIAVSATNSLSGKLRYLVLVPSDSPVQKIDDLRGKSVLAYSHADPLLTRLWIEDALRSRKFPSGEQFFGQFREALKPSAACLPLFFGKADACLIDDGSWSALQELNPQVSTKLRVVLQSEPLLEVMMSMHRDSRRARSQVLQSMYELGSDPQGQQVLLFFRARHAIRIQPSDLASVLELRRSFLAKATAAERQSILPGDLGSTTATALGSR